MQNSQKKKWEVRFHLAIIRSFRVLIYQNWDPSQTLLLKLSDIFRKCVYPNTLLWMLPRNPIVNHMGENSWRIPSSDFTLVQPIFRVTNIWPYSGWVFSGLLTDGQARKAPIPKFYHTYPTMMKLDTVIPYLKKFQKIYKSCDISSANIRIFSPEKILQQLLFYQEIQIQIPF